jgi:hypothetical protein
MSSGYSNRGKRRRRQRKLRKRKLKKAAKKIREEIKLTKRKRLRLIRMKT